MARARGRPGAKQDGARGLAAGPSRESPQASRWAEEEGRAGATGCVPWDSGRRCSCPEEPSASLGLGVGRAGVRSLGLGTLVRVDREGECSAPGGLRQEEVAGGRASKRAHLTVTSGFSRSDRSEPQSQAAGGPEAREKAGLNRRTKARPSRVGQLCPLRRIPFRASRRTGGPPAPVSCPSSEGSPSVAQRGEKPTPISWPGPPPPGQEGRTGLWASTWKVGRWPVCFVFVPDPQLRAPAGNKQEGVRAGDTSRRAGGRGVQQAGPNGGSAASFQVGCVQMASGVPGHVAVSYSHRPGLHSPPPPPRPSPSRASPPPGPSLPPAWQESRGILWLCLCPMKSKCSGIGPRPPSDLSPCPPTRP